MHVLHEGQTLLFPAPCWSFVSDIARQRSDVVVETAMRWEMFFHWDVFSKMIHFGLCSCLLHGRPDRLHKLLCMVVMALSNQVALEAAWEREVETWKINEVSGTALLLGHCPEAAVCGRPALIIWGSQCSTYTRPVVIWTPGASGVRRVWFCSLRNDTSRHNVSFISFLPKCA